MDFLPETIGGDLICYNNNWTYPIPKEILDKYKIDEKLLYTPEQLKKFKSYNFQYDYLTEFPEKYKELKQFGFAPGIRTEFDWLFNAIEMGLM